MQMFAMDEASWKAALHDSARSYKYQTFPDFIASKGFNGEELSSFPLAVDGMEFWAVVKKYVTAYLTLFFPDDESCRRDGELQAFWQHSKQSELGFDIGLPDVLSLESLIDFVTNCIFQVTGNHEYVGGIVEYSLDPSLMPTKIAPKQSVADVQSYFLFVSLTALTGTHMPDLMNDWTHIHAYLCEPSTDSSSLQGRHGEVLSVLASFQEDLRRLSEVVDARNKERSALWPRANSFNAFNPRLLQCSVSV